MKSFIASDAKLSPGFSSRNSASSPCRAPPARIKGELLKYVPIFGWLRRFIVLYDHKIVIKMREFLGGIGSFELNRHCIAADSAERDFCFFIRDTLNNTSISLAATDMASKEAWMDSVNGVLGMLRNQHLIEKTASGLSPSGPAGSLTPAPKTSANATTAQSHTPYTAEDFATSSANYQSRNMIYIKVMRAFNLLSSTESEHRGRADSALFSLGVSGKFSQAQGQEQAQGQSRQISAYVKVILGLSSAKTITMKGTCDDMEWGMLFSYAWDTTMRFGTVEVYETTMSADVLLGTALIPLFNCYDESKQSLELPLYRTSKGQRNVSCGSVELEISFEGSTLEKQHQLAWQFLRAAQKLPVMSTAVITREALAYKDSAARKARKNSLLAAGDDSGFVDMNWTVAGRRSGAAAIEKGRDNECDDDDDDDDDGLTKEYYTRHRHSLDGYQKSGVLDYVKASLLKDAAAAAAAADGEANSVSMSSISPKSTAARTPAKRALTAALDLSITPLSVAAVLTPLSALTAEKADKLSNTDQGSAGMGSALHLASGDNTPALGESMFVDVYSPRSPRNLSVHPVHNLQDTPSVNGDSLYHREGGSLTPLTEEASPIVGTGASGANANASASADRSPLSPIEGSNRTHFEHSGTDTRENGRSEAEAEADAEAEENEEAEAEDLLSSQGFPFMFPSTEVEHVEDFCMRADFESTMEGSEMSIHGVLLLTNYRLIFVTAARIFSEDEYSWREFVLSDLSTYVPVANIISVEYSSEKVVLSGGKTAQRERLKISTTEMRALTFSFTDVDVPYVQLQNRAMHLIRRCCTYTHAGVSKDWKHNVPGGDSYDASSSELGQLFYQIHKRGSHIVDGCGSAEGTVCKRMHRRLNMRCINRLSERLAHINQHAKLLTMVRSAVAVIPQTMTVRMWNLTDDERYDLLKAESEVLTAVEKSAQASANIEMPVPDSAISPAAAAAATAVVALDTAAAGNGLYNAASIRESGSLYALGRRLLASSLETRLALRSLLSSAWEVYNPLNEFLRMGLPNKLWRMTKANENYALCASYPAVLVVPAKVDDSVLMEAANFRSIRRIPNLVWRSRLNGQTISRCSQPLTGITSARSSSDEFLINHIHEASNLDDGGNVFQIRATSAGAGAATPVKAPSDGSSSSASPRPNMARRGSALLVAPRKPYIILDCRPLLNARANQAGGKGFENEQNYDNISIQWMDMENIHTVRQSYNQIEEAASKHTGWLVSLNNSGWLKHIRRTLIAAIKICHCVAIEEMSVLVHCSDGWDRTSQLTSLGMLMLDPFYRTIRGFIVLIEKEWVSFGHKFQDRTGWGADGHKDEKERSPVFIQWLDCVHQCLVQRPQDFEFNENLLLFIARHTYSGWFGNFLFNCEKDAAKAKGKMSILSIWTCVLCDIKSYRNKDYVVNPGLSIPVATKQRIQLWAAYFTRWNDHLWRAAWMADYSQSSLFLASDGYAGDEAYLHLNGGVLGTGGTEYDDNDAAALGDPSVVNRPWVDDKLIHACQRCNLKFNFLNRKHHCRCCGNVYCGTCANEYRLLAAVSTWTKQRVCASCAERIDSIKTSTNANTGGVSGTSDGVTSGGGGGGNSSGRDATNRHRSGDGVSPSGNGNEDDDTDDGSDSSGCGISFNAPPPPPMSATKAGREQAAPSVHMERHDSDDSWGIDMEALRGVGGTNGRMSRLNK